MGERKYQDWGRSPKETMLRDRLDRREVTDWQELEKELVDIYVDVCGDVGKDIFLSYVLPTAHACYVDNYTKMGSRLLEIIEDVADAKPTKTVDILSASFTQEEIEFGTRPRDELCEHLQQELTVSLKKAMDDDRHSTKQPIVAVLLYGSYAEENCNANSDINIVPIRASEATKSLQQYSHTSTAFLDYLEPALERLHIKGRPNFVLGMPSLSDMERLEELAEREKQLRGKIIVLSPDPDVKRTLEERFSRR